MYSFIHSFIHLLIHSLIYLFIHSFAQFEKKSVLLSSINFSPSCVFILGPSIYDVHREGEGVRLRWTPADGGGGYEPCGRLHRKLEPTDVFLSSSDAKKLVFFWTR